MPNYIKKSFSLLTVFIVTLFLFQNCTPNSFNPQGSDRSAAVNRTTGLIPEVCPMYNAPLCAPDEEISLVLGSDGCEQPTCVKSKNIQCPIYQAPLCEEHETLVSQTDDNGCVYYICRMKDPIKPPLECAQYMPPLCDGELMSVTNEFGCPVPVCVENKNPSCPQYMPPLCEEGSSIVINKDSQGCPMPVCSPVKN